MAPFASRSSSEEPHTDEVGKRVSWYQGFVEKTSDPGAPNDMRTSCVRILRRVPISVSAQGRPAVRPLLPVLSTRSSKKLKPCSGPAALLGTAPPTASISVGTKSVKSMSRSDTRPGATVPGHSAISGTRVPASLSPNLPPSTRRRFGPHLVTTRSKSPLSPVTSNSVSSASPTARR